MYFVQVDVASSMGSLNAYLPYTAGILVASAFSDKRVKDFYSFKEFIFVREDVSAVAERMEDPFFVGFSSYCWNTEYNKALAIAIKEKYPDCCIVFGGHNVPDDFSFLEEYPYIDILCHGEGEDTTRLLMIAIAEGADLSSVPNISFRGQNGFVRTETTVQCSLEYPSPYLGGWFDDIVDSHPEITFNAILETSRGCPNGCAYCDWGLLKSRVRMFPLERVKAEIKWFSDHKIAFIWGADANFGLYDRDLEIADELVKAKKTTGYPERMRMNYAKNRFENVFAIVKKFKECEFDRIGATLSFQSMSPVVLKNIGRTNKDLDFYRNLLTKYNSEGMKTYSELILGLPGETYESFTEGICTLFDIGQHFVFEVYACILLPNSEMGRKEYVEKHGIKTERIEIIRPHFNGEEFSIPEYNSIIVETNTMSREMWVKSMLFYYIAKAFHGNGLLRAFAIYLNYEGGVKYNDYYNRLLDYFLQTPNLFTSKIICRIERHQKNVNAGIVNEKLIFGPAGNAVWDDHEYMVLTLLERIDEFFDDVLPFLRSFDIPDDVFSDLFAYQKAILRRPNDESHILELKHDVHAFLSGVYLNDIQPLKKKEHRLTVRDSDMKTDWPSFGKYVVWYGRMGWASYKDDVSYE